MSFGDDTLDTANEEKAERERRAFVQGLEAGAQIVGDMNGDATDLRLAMRVPEGMRERIRGTVKRFAGKKAKDRIRELEKQFADIRRAHKTDDKYDLVSLAKTLTVRSEMLDTLETFIGDFVKPLAESIGHMRGIRGRSKVRDLAFGEMLDALDSVWETIDRHMAEKATKFPWDR